MLPLLVILAQSLSRGERGDADALLEEALVARGGRGRDVTGGALHQAQGARHGHVKLARLGSFQSISVEQYRSREQGLDFIRGGQVGEGGLV